MKNLIQFCTIAFTFILFPGIANSQLTEPTRDLTASISGTTADARLCPYTSVRDSSGVLFMYWLDLSLSGGRLSKSTDNGTSWSNVGVLTSTNFTSPDRFKREAIIKVGSEWFLSSHYHSPGQGPFTQLMLLNQLMGLPLRT